MYVAKLVIVVLLNLFFLTRQLLLLIKLRFRASVCIVILPYFRNFFKVLRSARVCRVNKVSATHINNREFVIWAFNPTVHSLSPDSLDLFPCYPLHEYFNFELYCFAIKECDTLVLPLCNVYITISTMSPTRKLKQWIR